MDAVSYQGMNAGRNLPGKEGKDGKAERPAADRDEFPGVLPADDVPSLKDERFGSAGGQHARVAPGLAALRSDLKRTLAMFKVSDEIAKEIEEALTVSLDPVCENYLEQFLSIRERKNGGDVTREKYVSLAGDVNMDLPLMDRARQIGAVYFFSKLIKRDSVLAESLLEFYTAEGTESDLLTQRMETFWREQKQGDLHVAPDLLAVSRDDQVNAAEKAIFDGMVRSYCDCASAQPVPWYVEFLRWAGFAKPEADGYFLTEAHRSFLRQIATSQNELERQRRGVDARLRDIVGLYNITDKQQLVQTLESYVDGVNALSMRETAMIMQAIPRGLDWGTDNGITDLRTIIKSGFKLETEKEIWVSKDIRIVIIAFGKTSRAEGMEFAGTVGTLAKEIFKKSRTVKDLESGGHKLAGKIINMLDNEYQAMMARLISSESK